MGLFDGCYFGDRFWWCGGRFATEAEDISTCDCEHHALWGCVVIDVYISKDDHG